MVEERAKVLVVDDAEDIHFLLGYRLRGEPLDLLHASTLAEGEEMARRLRPDLVLLDVMIGEESGFDLCRILKADPELALLPIVFLSVSDDPASKAAGLDLGAVDYLTKPFAAVELVARVRAALRTGRTLRDLHEKSGIDLASGLLDAAALARHLDGELSWVSARGRQLGRLELFIDGAPGLVGRRLHGCLAPGEVAGRVAEGRYVVVMREASEEEVARRLAVLKGIFSAAVVSGAVLP